MSKTIVNIISDECPIPAYLFIKEMYETGDRLMFISARRGEESLEHLASLFSISKDMIDEVVFMHDCDEFMYEHICRRLKNVLNEDVHYYVNLAGGTRYLALAIQQAFRKCHTDFYYVNVKGNTIVSTIYDDSIYDDDDISYPIKYRMTVAEYLSLHNLQHDLMSDKQHKPTCSRQYAYNLLKFFTNKQIPKQYFNTLDKLRIGYRNAKSTKGNQTLQVIKRKSDISISEIQHPHNSNWYAIPELSDFLNSIDFKTRKLGSISKDEIDFLTGGWFEQYVYYLMLKYVQPDDIHIGVHIKKKNVPYHDNELDVVFTKNNHIYVMECKTGVDNNSMFNEIVYKACALKDALLGLSCHSFIISLKKDNPEDGLKKVAANMDVTFIDYTLLAHPMKWINEISLGNTPRI